MVEAHSGPKVNIWRLAQLACPVVKEAVNVTRIPLPMHHDAHL